MAMLCGPAAKSACSRSTGAGCRHSHVLQSPTRARHKSTSDLRWIRVMEIQARRGPRGRRFPLPRALIGHVVLSPRWGLVFEEKAKHTTACLCVPFLSICNRCQRQSQNNSATPSIVVLRSVHTLLCLSSFPPLSYPCRRTLLPSCTRSAQHSTS